MSTLIKINCFKKCCGVLGTVYIQIYIPFFPFYLLYRDLKSKIGFLFNSYHWHFNSIMQSSTKKPMLLLLLYLSLNSSLVQYELYARFLIQQQLDNSHEGAPLIRKNIIIQTQYKSFNDLMHPLLYPITLI